MDPSTPTPRPVRIAAARWRMGECPSFDAFADAVRAAVEEAAPQACEVILFPEYFTTQLLTTLPPTDEPEQLEALAGRVDDLHALFARCAEEASITIVGGTWLRQTDAGARVNEAPVFFPGVGAPESHRQVKLHRTPFEREEWRIDPGDRLRIFSAPWGRFAVLICYDVEFPELARLAADAGADCLFVPYSTDDAAGHHRVRHCARARAVENSIAVVTAGNAGALPALASDPDHFGEAALFTPCDAGFPADGILAETDPPRGTAIPVGPPDSPGADLAIALVDLAAIGAQRESGTVRPARDRRDDLYSLTSTISIDEVR